MPKFPHFSLRPEAITGSVFEKFQSKMASHGSNLMKLHIGDTYLPTRYPLPISSALLEEHPDYNRYCNTFGVESLRDALVDKLRSDNNLAVVPAQILVTAGATNALSISMTALLNDGDEVLVLSPAWPFFFGMVSVAGGHVVDVPFYMKLYEDPDLDILTHLDNFITERSVALYLNTPNNPSGKVLSQAQIEQVAQVAKKHDLWVISDEAYDGLTFDDRPHISIAALPDMFERTLTVFTFSKSLMFAGLRLGYVIAGQEAIKRLNKMMVHQIYSPSTLAQMMMVEPVNTRAAWLPAVRQHYEELRDVMAQSLHMDMPLPEAGYFFFFSVSKHLKGRDYWEVVEACLDEGVAVAPGDSFGASYGNYIRLCFTGEPRERLEKGIDRFNKVLLGNLS